VKPLISIEERNQTIRNFIVARYQGLAKIGSYQTIVPYLSGKRIKILCPLEMSGRETHRRQVQEPSYAYPHEEISVTKFYNEGDAKTYFEWLVSVVTVPEKFSETIVKEANDQLFQFIHVMRDNIQMDKNVQLIAPYDWQALFTSFDERLTDMQRILAKGEKDIVETLSMILLWIKKYGPVLDALENERKELFGARKKK
jgi:hypothetical protein